MMKNTLMRRKTQMSKKSLKPSLIEYINSFNKRPGEYTKEDLLDIGKFHQSLLRSEKDWDGLAKYLGINKSGEQYRKWVLHDRYKHNLVPKNPKVLADKTIDEATKDDMTNSLTQQKQDLLKERMRVRDERTSLNRTLRNEARLERFIQTIKDVAHEYKALPHVTVEPKSTSEMTCEAVYGLADLHLGPEFSNYINSYNQDEAVKRINKIAEDIIYYCNLHHVTTLHFINLGDLVAGIIHPTIRLEQEYDVITQILKVAGLVTELVYVLKQYIPEVTYRTVVDNHARVVADKNQHIELENLNRIVDVFVEERLINSGVKFPKDNIDIGIGRLELQNGKKLFFMHGHEDRKSSVVQDIMGLTHEFPDYILMAHYHNSAEHTFQGAKVFISGSIIGTDSYAFGKRLFGQPEQKLLIFDGRNNVLDLDIRCNL